MDYDSLKDAQSGLEIGTDIVAAISRFAHVGPPLLCFWPAKTPLE